MTWDTIAASVTGTKHKKVDKGCEDAHGFWTNDNYAIFAVADGAGSAKSAATGSDIAVKALINYIKHKALLSRLPNNPKDLRILASSLVSIVRYELEKKAMSPSTTDSSEPFDSSEYAPTKSQTRPFGRDSRKPKPKEQNTKNKQNVLEVVLKFLGLIKDNNQVHQNELVLKYREPSVINTQQIDSENKYEKQNRTVIASKNKLKDYSTTILAVLVTPRWLLALQIGDGVIVVQQGNKLLSLTTPSKGQYHNITDFVTSASYLDKLQQLVIPNTQIDKIFLMTDGLESLAINFQTNDPHPGFFANIIDYFQSLEKDTLENLEKDKNILLAEMLDGKSVNKKTDDDKTLLIATKI